jgi:hypothetical protein
MSYDGSAGVQIIPGQVLLWVSFHLNVLPLQHRKVLKDIDPRFTAGGYHCRMRKGYSDQNMAILRHISLNLLKSETEHKVGIKIKRQMAGWDSDYLLKVLQVF